MRRIYLDHAATTPLDPRVLEAMLPFLKDQFGNASSVHALGRQARHAVEESRERIADHLGAEPAEIIFTSGGTEADNLAIKGVLRGERRHLITSAAEHEAVLRPSQTRLERGLPTTILRPQSHGAVMPEQVEAAIRPDTGLVSLMHANNELGTCTPVERVSEICRRRGVLFHCDAVQTAGYYRLGVDEMGVDLLSLSAHKFYGPKGVGVLYVRSGVALEPLLEGGAQERRRRGGTENVAAIVGLATALDLAMDEAEARLAHMRSMRDRLYRQVREAFGDSVVVNTPFEDSTVEVAPHIVNVSFPPVEGRALDGEMLLLNLDMEGVLVSAGSACTSGALEPSHVLEAIGRDRPTASATVRFSLGKDTTERDVDEAVERLERVVRRMRRRPAVVS